jgi:hypothetical protein
MPPLNPSTVQDNPSGQAGYASTRYVTDQLIAVRFGLVTSSITLASGSLARGTVLGQVTSTRNFIKSVATASDGSQVPVAVLADDANASAGPVVTSAYLAGEFFANRMTYDASWTLSTLTAALRDYGIFIKTMSSALSADDPT